MLWKWKLDEGNKFVTKKKERQLVGLTKLVNKDESWGREWLMNESVYAWRKQLMTLVGETISVINKSIGMFFNKNAFQISCSLINVNHINQIWKI